MLDRALDEELPAARLVRVRAHAHELASLDVGHRAQDCFLHDAKMVRHDNLAELAVILPPRAEAVVHKRRGY